MHRSKRLRRKSAEKPRRNVNAKRKKNANAKRRRNANGGKKRQRKTITIMKIVMRTVTRLPPMIMVPKWLLERTQSHRQTEAPKAKKLQTMLVDLWETPMWQAARASQKGRIVLALRSLSTRHLATAFRETRLPSGASGKR